MTRQKWCIVQPLALLCQFGNDAVDLILGAHVNAAGRLVQNEDVRVVGQPAADQHLLLVAAGQGLDQRLGGRGLDGQLGHVFLHQLLDLLVVQHDAADEVLVQRGHGDVVLNDPPKMVHRSTKVGCISHDMRILGRIVGVQSTEQSAGIIVGVF